jgi:HPt (histidine-containing phosphotransfer) domain-containing protein
MRLTIELVTALGDDLPLEAVLFGGLGVLLLQRLGEIAHQFLGQVGVLGHVRLQQLLVEHQLGVGEQHREFRPGQALAARLALGQFRIRGQELELAIEQSLRFERADEVLLGAEPGHAHPFHQADRLVLAVVVVEDQGLDLVGHLRQQPVARREGQLLPLHLGIEQDLDVDLVVGGVHARRIVDEVGVEQHAVLGRLDPAELGQAEVAALAHHLAAQLAAVDAQRVVGAVADVGMAFEAALDVGADAAVPQQVDRRLEDRLDQFGGREGADRLEPQRGADLGIERDRLGERGNTPPPLLISDLS